MLEPAALSRTLPSTVLPRAVAVLLAAALLALGAPAHAQDCRLDDVVSPAPQNGAAFGRSMDLDGEWLLVGSPEFDGRRGRVEAFRRDGLGWVPAGELPPPPGIAELGFGTSLSIDGGLAAVGSPLQAIHGSGSGSVQLYRLEGETWVRIATVAPTSGAVGELFGWSVGLRNDTLAVGAPRRFVGPNKTGSASVFDITGTTVTLVAELVASNAADQDAFGLSLDLEGDALIVGAPFADRQRTDCGAAYVFERAAGTWSEVGELAHPTPVPDARLGWAVAISEPAGISRIAFVGAPRDEDFGGQRTGTVFTYLGFVGMPWGGGFTQRFNGHFPDVDFGSTIDLATDWTRALIGAPNATGGGRAYVYEPIGNPWLENGSVGLAGQLGASVRLDGDGALVGDPERQVVERYGVAYNFQGGEDCDADGMLDLCQLAAGADDLDRNGVLDVCQTSPGVVGCAGACPCGNDPAVAETGCLHSGGVGMRISGLGTASIADDDLVLVVTDAPIENTGLFVAGTSEGPPLPLYDGLFCLSGSSLRFRPRVQTNGVVTDSELVAQDPSGAFFTPGATIRFQYWSRDTTSRVPSPCGTGANFSPTFAVVMMP